MIRNKSATNTFILILSWICAAPIIRGFDVIRPSCRGRGGTETISIEGFSQAYSSFSAFEIGRLAVTGGACARIADGTPTASVGDVPQPIVSHAAGIRVIIGHHGTIRPSRPSHRPAFEVFGNTNHFF